MAGKRARPRMDGSRGGGDLQSQLPAEETAARLGALRERWHELEAQYNIRRPGPVTRSSS